MKFLSSILAIGFILTNLAVAAQSDKPTGAEPASATPTVVKGFYGIGNNATKLGRPSVANITANGSYPVIQKGYYSIGNNNRKLGEQIIIQGTAAPVAPKATKGYYSINRTKKRAA